MSNLISQNLNMIFKTPKETKKSMKSGNLDAFLKGMGTPKGNVDTSFLPL